MATFPLSSQLDHVPIEIDRNSSFLFNRYIYIDGCVDAPKHIMQETGAAQDGTHLIWVGKKSIHTITI